MLKIAVCDDEKNIVEKIKCDIFSYPEKCEIDGFYSGEELLLSQKNYDIIFLDIDMKGMNGIEVAKRLREEDKNVKIIYVTSYTDYVNYAFSVHAFAYLLKPVKTEDIHKQLDEAKAYYKDVVEPKLRRFVTKEGTVELNIHEIYYMEYTERHVVMKTKGQEYILPGGISAIAEKMETYGFAMPHKSFCVNLYQVKNIKGYDIFMMNGDTIPLSQKKSVEFRKKLHDFLVTIV